MIFGYPEGTELLEPGVVTIPAWRPDHELTDEDRALDYGHAGVGIKEWSGYPR